jgi:hypothetical protein
MKNCKDCHYFLEHPGYYPNDCHNEITIPVIETNVPVEQLVPSIKKTPEEFNANNDCVEYMPKYIMRDWIDQQITQKHWVPPAFKCLCCGVEATEYCEEETNKFRKLLKFIPPWSSAIKLTHRYLEYGEATGDRSGEERLMRYELDNLEETACLDQLYNISFLSCLVYIFRIDSLLSCDLNSDRLLYIGRNWSRVEHIAKKWSFKKRFIFSGMLFFIASFFLICTLIIK